MRVRQLCFLLVLVGLYPASTWAQANSDYSICAAPLKKDVMVRVSSDDETYTFISMVDERTYELLKHDVDTGASIPIPALGDLLKGSANYSDFNEKRRSYLSQRGYSASISKEAALLTISTAQTAYTAFSACIEQLAKDKEGLYVWKTADNPDVVVLSYYFHPGPQVTSGKVTDDVVTNGISTSAGAPQGRLFAANAIIPVNSRGSIQVRRVPGQPHMTITLSVGGYTSPVVESEFRPLPPVIGQATLDYTVGGLEQSLGSISKQTTVDDNNDRGCDHDPCSPDGKWQASHNAINLSALQSTTLRNPRLVCNGAPSPQRQQWEQLAAGGSPFVGPIFQNILQQYRNACAFIRIDEVSVSPDGKSATARFMTWSRNDEFELFADAILGSPPVSAMQTHEARSGQEIRFEIPEAASPTKLTATVNGTSYSLPPGSSSPDGVLTLVGDTKTPAHTRIIIYRVK